MKGFFVTGTDTGVGKTFFTAWWVRALRAAGIKACGFKPFLSGERTDAEVLHKANDGEISIDQVNPIWLKAPLSPYAACLVEDRPLDWEALRGHWEWVRSSFQGVPIVEGVGGWLVPLDEKTFVREWAQELNLPVVIVCRGGLGTLNHTLLTVESVRSAKLPIAGLVMNFHQTPDDLAARTNPAILEQLTGLPILKMQTDETSRDLPKWLLP